MCTPQRLITVMKIHKLGSLEAYKLIHTAGDQPVTLSTGVHFTEARYAVS